MSNGALALIGLLLMVLGITLAVVGVLSVPVSWILSVPGGFMLGCYGMKCILE